VKRRRDCTCLFIDVHAGVDGFGLEVHSTR
jgi:hypothetical protein